MVSIRPMRHEELGPEPPADVVLYQGDCMDMLGRMESGSVQLVVTSPPYNLGKPYETDLRIDDYVEEQGRVIRECARVLDERGSICWQVGNYVNDGEILPLDVLLYPLFARLDLHLRNRIVWHFGHGLHASKRFSGRYETILWFSKSKEYRFNLDAVRVPQKYPEKKYFKGPNRGMTSGNPLGKNPTDVWDIPNVKANHVEKTDHPCQFPVELVERLVLALTDEGGVVFDPFLGSGTTCLAALAHSRRAMGAELSPDYYQLAMERIQLASQGRLRIRPAERPVYDPDSPVRSIPPRVLDLGKNGRQTTLLELRGRYAERRESQ